MYHTEKQQLKKAKVLAAEALKLDSMCRGDVSDKEKEYQLSQVAALAREVAGDTSDYNPLDDFELMQ